MRHPQTGLWVKIVRKMTVGPAKVALGFSRGRLGVALGQVQGYSREIGQKEKWKELVAKPAQGCELGYEVLKRKLPGRTTTASTATSHRSRASRRVVGETLIFAFLTLRVPEGAPPEHRAAAGSVPGSAGRGLWQRDLQGLREGPHAEY